MGITELDDLGAMHLDVLRELGNIGSGNAATSLASLLNTTVDIKVPTINLISYDNVAEYLGGKDNRMVGLSFKLVGDLDGYMLHLVQDSFVDRIINAFYPKELSSLDDLNDMDISALSEVGNISTASYVNSLAQLTGTYINISPPSSSIDTIENILEEVSSAIDAVGNQVLYIDESLYIAGTEVQSSMILILSIDSMKVLFDKLSIPY